MLPCDSSTDSKPPVGAEGVRVSNSSAGRFGLTKTTGVLNSLMIKVAVLCGVGVVVRVGVSVMVGVMDAVGV